VSEFEGSDFGATGNLPPAPGGGTNYLAGAFGLAGAGLTALSTYESVSRGTGSGSPETTLVGAGLAGLGAGVAVYGLAGGASAAAGSAAAASAAAAAGVAGVAVAAAVLIANHFAEEEASARKQKLQRRQHRKQQAADITSQIANTVNSDIAVSEMLARQVIIRGDVFSVNRIITKEVPGPSTGGLLMRLAEESGYSPLSDFLREYDVHAEDLDVERALGLRYNAGNRGFVNSVKELAASIDDVTGFLADVLKSLRAAADRDAQERAFPATWNAGRG
jgi:hypothetical protein